MERIFSGIQPSGELHIGNWLGAIRNWVTLQDTCETIYSVVDLHSMTLEYDPAELVRRVLDMSRTLLACGVDPARSILFVQSHAGYHPELAWILSCVTPMGELSRMTQFKDKSRQHEDNINTGLFTYPVLQAADIVLYKGTQVPVGEDQVQHVELTREIVRKFNARFGNVFPEPRALLTRTARIRGLDGQAKMSKSLGNHIPLLASPERIAELLRPAFTDPARLRKSDPGNPDICNIFAIHQGFSAADQVAAIDAGCRSASMGCVECKRILGKAMADGLAPIRDRYESLSVPEVRDILRDGATRARAIATRTMTEVRRATGMDLESPPPPKAEVPHVD